MTQARLQDKVAFVTGGGTGIGAATAIRFAQEGAVVVVCGRRREPLDSVVAQILAAGGRAEAVQADVSDEAGLTAAIEAAAQRHGRLDILVNNAMAYSWGSIESTSTADWHSNFSNGMAMLHRNTTIETPCMSVLNKPSTPLQTVSCEDCPRISSCMMGKKFAGMYSNNAAITKARLRCTTL